MSASRFIASVLARREPSSKDGDRLSHISRNIAWISVALSIATIIIAFAVVAGFKKEIRAKATGFMGAVILVPPGQGPLNEICPFDGNISWRGALDSLKGVVSVSPVAGRSGMVKSDDGIAGLYFKGVDSLYDFSFFRDCISEGKIPDYSGRISNDALISSRLASELGYKVGDRMITYFIGDKLKARSFTVCGLFDAQLEDVDKSFAIVDIRQVRRVAGWEEGQVSALEVRIEPNAGIDEMRQEVEDLEYCKSSDDDASLFALSARKIYSNLFDWLALLDLNVLMILILMVAVAGFNMISAILIILFRNISTIGILKSMGMKSRDVTRVFLLRAAAIVGKGMLWGNVLAFALCLVQMWFRPLTLNPANYFVKYVPISLDIPAILLVDALCALVIMLLLTLSSRFVASISPDKTVRTN